MGGGRNKVKKRRKEWTRTVSKILPGVKSCRLVLKTGCGKAFVNQPNGKEGKPKRGFKEGEGGGLTQVWVVSGKGSLVNFVRVRLAGRRVVGLMQGGLRKGYGRGGGGLVVEHSQKGEKGKKKQETIYALQVNSPSTLGQKAIDTKKEDHQTGGEEGGGGGYHRPS